MIFEILTNPTDDPQFVELLVRLLSRLVGEQTPAEIFVMKIDNWFDHKWLNFSGIGRVGFFHDFRLEKDTALDEFRQDKVTFPPFTPKRVIEEYYFERDQSGSYASSLAAPLVHQRKLAHSSDNLHKRVTDFADSALFMWVSSNTKLNRRGSIMVYEVNGYEVQTWYIGLLKQENWNVSQTKSIARDRVISLI
jgi:hypothetical protein